MGFYRDQLLPRIQDKVMNRPPLADVRARVCRGLEGDVVEIGFGTGLNVPHYPAEVVRVAAVEPSAVCMHLAEVRTLAAPIPVRQAGLNGESLDLPDDAYDAALSTWTMCTIPDLPAALGELRRVLKPGGALHFVEHGHSPDDAVYRWQRRIEPAWKHVAGGCHVTRDISSSLTDAGFEIESLDTYYLEGEPKPFGYTFEGRAVSR